MLAALCDKRDVSLAISFKHAEKNRGHACRVELSHLQASLFWLLLNFSCDHCFACCIWFSLCLLSRSFVDSASPLKLALRLDTAHAFLFCCGAARHVLVCFHSFIWQHICFAPGLEPLVAGTSSSDLPFLTCFT
eukprot:6211859-Pleurochrysis_carterae.AAC.2